MFSGGRAAIRRRTSSELRRICLFGTPTTPLLHPLSTTSASKDSNDHSAASPGPPPIRVALTEAAGRGVFATRGIATGELIHTAKPLLAHPSPSLNNQVCYYCLKKLGKDRDSILPLGGDRTSLSSADIGSCRFCSEGCREHSKGFCEVERKADWSLYDENIRIRRLKYPLMVKRLACMVISGAVSAGSLDILQPASLHSEMILEMEEEFELLKCTLIKAEIKEDLVRFLTKQWYISVLSRIRINAFRIELVGGSYEDLLSSAAASLSSDAAVGNAVYMLPSFYNHDCDPNAHIVWIENADARLKALRNIEAGEELRICYIDASMEHEARQKLLAYGFGFQCCCLRCLSGD